MDKQPAQSAYLQAYEYIRDNILNGGYPRGMKLVEERLAEELGMSRTPIRESIRKLEQEGLIKHKKVVNPTAADLYDMFQVRMLLEGYSARCAASYMDEAALAKLQECITIARQGPEEETMRANQLFHELIVQASNNPLMIDIIDKMQSMIYLFRKTVVYHKRPHLLDEHQQIYEAIVRHDGDEAERLMKAHLQADLDFSLRFIR